ncbi:hypothetical protein [Pseudanabaena sp. PCC 6802]|uniref:hypothetical protein n=1 Tax=Pseudanabaena sp. PCC 6802 TaxID=118173 RepID=UPI00034DAC3E|nr:hypothetical protein [Pseudanabaena sp. PCC 6802]
MAPLSSLPEALRLAQSESLRKSSDRSQKVAARELRERNRATSTGRFIRRDPANGKYELELSDGSRVFTDYESNASLRIGEIVGVVMPKYSAIGKSYKVPR